MLATWVMLVTSLTSQNGWSADLSMLNFLRNILVAVVKTPGEATHDFQMRLFLRCINHVLALHLHIEVSIVIPGEGLGGARVICVPP